MKITTRSQRRIIRVRKKIRAHSNRPRLTVFRSNKAIYAQLVDDTKGETIIGAKDTKAATDKAANKIDRAKALGIHLAQELVAKKIKTIVFDRSGYKYHGRIKALADGLREGGIEF